MPIGLGGTSFAPVPDDAAAELRELRELRESSSRFYLFFTPAYARARTPIFSFSHLQKKPRVRRGDSRISRISPLSKEEINDGR
jgi:hypothetical protein